MASTLAAQLQELARQRPALPATLRKGGKPSLLYDFQRAADVDLPTIHDIASQGLDELIRLEPRFRPYRESLFSRASLDINPDLQTPDFLAKLDESIHGFCCLLCNFFLAAPAFKALEYLIRRYKANERNVDSLLTAALPYHSTNEFVRLVQVLALGPQGSLWGWMVKMQSSGASMPRDLLAQRCANDKQLLLFVCKAAGQLGSIPSGAQAALRPPSRTFLSFYAVLLCEVLSVLPAVSEDFLTSLLPFLLEGLGRGAGQDYRAATLMVVAELCSKATLGRDCIKVLLNSMFKHTEPMSEHVRTALLVAAHVAVTQRHMRTLSDKTLKYLSALPNAMEELCALAQRGNMRLGPLLVLLARSLAQSLCGGDAKAAGRCEADLLALAHAGVLEGEPAGVLAAALLEGGCAAAAGTPGRSSCQKLLRILDQRYPSTTDAAVNAFLEPLRTHQQQQRHKGAPAADGSDDAGKRKRHKADKASKDADAKKGKKATHGSDDEDEDEDDDAAALSAEAASEALTEQQRARFDFVRTAFAQGGGGGALSAPCGGTMMTLGAALSAPQAAVRRMALQQLAADFQSAPGTEPSASEPRPILASALSRLADDDLGVVVAALGCSCLLHQLPPAALLDALQPLLHRLAVHLYGSEKLPGLKAAKRAALKAVSWLQHIGGSCAGGASEGEGSVSPLLQRVVLQLLALLLPSRKDPRVAVEAAKALGAVGGPLFAGLPGAAPSLEALLRGEAFPAEDAAAAAATTKAAKGKKGSKAAAAAAAPAAAEGGKPASKADRKAAAAAVEQRVVGALAKHLAADPAGLSPKVVQLVQNATAAAATSGDGADGAAGIAAIRAQHVLLLASHATAAAVDGAAKAKAASAASLHRSAVQLSEMLLPYVSLGRGVAASDDGDWSAAFASHVTDASLPTPEHCSAAQSDIVSTHAVVVLGVLQANLRALPEATAASAAPTAAASVTRSLGLLASLGCPHGRLHDLPMLIVTRAVAPASRSSLLASLYSVTPSSTPAAPTPTATQCLALYTQARLAADSAATGSAKSAADVGPWLPTLLPALASPESAVRAAACDTVRTLWELLSSGKASAGQYLPADAAAAVCSAILRHRALICRDPDAAAFLIRGSLVGRPGVASAAAAEPAVAPTPSKKTRGGKAAAAASEPDAATAAAAARSGASLELPDAAAASLRTFLVRSLPSCTTDPAGTSTAAALVSCLLPEPTSTAAAAAAAASTSASPAPAAAPSISEELYASAWAYLAAAVMSVSEHPTATSPLQGELLTQLLRIFTPASASAAIARGAADTLATLATAAELLPPPPSVPCPAAAVAALAAARAAAVTAVTPQLFALLPTKIASAVFTSLLVRYEGDPDEGVRAAARASLDALPLHASFLTPMLNMHSDAAAAELPPPTPATKKSKKADGAAAATPATPAVALPALRDAVVALEFLQWRTGIDGTGLLVASCQAVLRKLKPVMGSIVAPLGGEAEAGPEADDAPAAVAAAAAAVPAEGEDAAASEAAMSSLAGYACTLSLQALTLMARDEPDVVVGSGEQQQAKGKKGSSTAAAAAPPAFDLELVVAMAREAPDSAVRNAALGLMATLAGRAPQAALSHVLQVLSVVNTSAALQDDEYSRSVCDTALAAVVPAWVAAGHGSAALWAEAAAALPSLPPQRRLDLLLALLRALPKPEEGLPEGLLLLLRTSLAPPTQPQAAAPQTPPPAAAKTPKAKSAKKAKADAAAAAAPAPVEVPQGPPPSEWLPELASSLAMQVDLPVRLSCCARLLELALADSKQQPHLALPRTCVAFVTAQLRLKAALSAASAQLRRPDPALDAACSRLMAAALAQMQLLQPDAIAADRGSAAASPTAPASAAALQRAVLSSSKALYALFGALQGVMAADTYLVALLSLASHPSDKVKRRAIKLFTDKVRGVRAEIEDLVELPQRVRDAKLRQASEASAKACGMFAPLLKPHDGGEEGSGASPLTRQLALVGLAAIATEFGSLQHAALLAGVPSVLAATKDRHASVRASALAAVAALVRALGTRLVPVLPVTVSAAVAAADAAWGRLSRSGGGGDDVEMEEEEGGASEVSGDEASEDEGEEGGAKGSSGVSRAQAREEEAALELSSALACLNALVESLGGFLSPHLAPVLAILLNPRVLACSVAGCDRFAASIRARLPSAIPPRLLLPALYERLQPCVAAAADVPADGSTAAAAVATAPLVALLDMVGSAAAAMEAKVAVQYHEHMFAFLLRALDIRQRRPAQLAAHGEAAIDLVEAAAVRALVCLVMKLSEARFKPLFLRLLEWASTVTVPETGSTEPGYLGRMVSLFAAVNALVDRLRSVLVPYYRYLLDTAVQHLGGDEEAGAGGKPRGKKKQKRGSSAAAGADDAPDGGEAGQVLLRLSWLLRLRIVRALHRCFLHDTVSFIDADRFARLQPALMSQLDAEPPAPAAALLSSPHHADKDLSAYLTLGATTAAYTSPDGARSAGPLGAAAVGALLAMAVAANSDALWKPLNHAALMMTRSSSPRTRALALELVAQLVDRLREEYLVLLPEALPFFSELLEDVDASVSARVREVVAQLEEISGEKLDEYLKV